MPKQEHATAFDAHLEIILFSSCSREDLPGTRSASLRCMSPVVCWFLDAGNDETLRGLNWPASKKRQGTKSREVWHPAEQRAL
jgi:hypothetical protein